ncbi:hypothetical protein [Candidatus Palauibacter sp.]|uniref:hypothetical protein n=1 Tax=Candidatus Palauibacter sp. TaxID=3101350 RepID=UPI003D0F2505
MLLQGVPWFAAAQVQVWELVEEYRFTGSESLPIGDVQTLVSSPDGAVFVVGRDDAAIHVLGSTGEYRGTVGGEGGGPGEFRVAPWIGIQEDDVLWALDRIGRRVTWLTLSGQVLDVRPIPAVLSREGLSTAAIAILDNGKAVFLESASSSRSIESLGRGREVQVTSLDGEAENDTGPALKLDVSTLSLRFTLPIGVGVAAEQPWSTRDLLAASPRGDGFVIVRGRGTDQALGRYELQWFDADGTLVTSRSVDFEAAPLERESINSFLDGTSEGFAERFGVNAGSLRRAIARELYTPDYLPGVATNRRGWSGGGVLIAADGTTWVQQQDADGLRWIVFDQTGATVAEIPAPEDLVLHHIGAQNAWGVREDAFGTPVVYRYTIARGKSNASGRPSHPSKSIRWRTDAPKTDGPDQSDVKLLRVSTAGDGRHLIP